VAETIQQAIKALSSISQLHIDKKISHPIVALFLNFVGQNSKANAVRGQGSRGDGVYDGTSLKTFASKFFCNCSSIR